MLTFIYHLLLLVTKYSREECYRPFGKCVDFLFVIERKYESKVTVKVAAMRLWKSQEIGKGLEGSLLLQNNKGYKWDHIGTYQDLPSSSQIIEASKLLRLLKTTSDPSGDIGEYLFFPAYSLNQLSPHLDLRFLVFRWCNNKFICINFEKFLSQTIEQSKFT